MSEQLRYLVDKIIKIDKIDTPTYKYTTASLSRRGTVTSIKRSGVNLVLLAQPHPLVVKCCGNASAYK